MTELIEQLRSELAQTHLEDEQKFDDHAGEGLLQKDNSTPADDVE